MHNVEKMVSLIIKEGVLSNKSKLFDSVNDILNIIPSDNTLNQLYYNNFENLIDVNSDFYTIDKDTKNEWHTILIKEIEEIEEELNINPQEGLSDVVKGLKKVQENFDKGIEPSKTVLEVYEVEEWLYKMLRKENEPVLNCDFGYYWGRTYLYKPLEHSCVLERIARQFINLIEE